MRPPLTSPRRPTEQPHQHSTVQHSTVQYSTVQYSTVQYGGGGQLAAARYHGQSSQGDLLVGWLKAAHKDSTTQGTAVVLLWSCYARFCRTHNCHPVRVRGPSQGGKQDRGPVPQSSSSSSRSSRSSSSRLCLSRGSLCRCRSSSPLRGLPGHWLPLGPQKPPQHQGFPRCCCLPALLPLLTAAVGYCGRCAAVGWYSLRAVEKTAAQTRHSLT
jgi:hypothetical protein